MAPPLVTLDSMQLHQFAHLFNVSGFAVVLAVSAAVLPTFATAYYRSWLGAYGFGLIFLGAQTAGTFVGHTPLLSLIGLGSVLAMVWFLTQTRLQIQERRPLDPRLFFALFVPAIVVIAVLLFRDQFNLAALVPATLLTIAYVRLGVTLLKHLAGSSQGAVKWLGFPLILTGLLPLTFPFTANTRFEWIGYYFGGLLNLLTGICMLVFLLQDAALQLRRKNEELTRLDHLKSNFISTMSHEFRTPLTAIKSASWLIGRIPEQRDELVGTLINNVDHLDRLVGDVLDFSQMEAGLMRYHKVDTSLRAIAAQVVQAMRPLYQQKGVELAIVSEHEDVSATIDAEKIGLVLRNLVSNALKFTASGGRVEIRLDREAEWAIVQVTDTGIGIAPEHQGAIFEKFFQVDNTSTRKAGGTGLGLTISRGIVEDGHGGRLDVRSDPGAGSTFTVRLPIAAPSPKSAV